MSGSPRLVAAALVAATLTTAGSFIIRLSPYAGLAIAAIGIVIFGVILKRTDAITEAREAREERETQNEA